MRLFDRALVLFLILLLSGCASGADSITSVFPGESWARIDAESAGYSADRLKAVQERLGTLATTGCMVVAGGRVLLEYGDTAEVSYVASVRKSVLAMLYGNYIASGKIRLSKTLREMGIDDHGGLLPGELDATVADLLGARSGIYHVASNPGDNLASAPPRGSQVHGTYFLYSNWDFNALGTIFEQETGRNLYDALESDIVRPIGMQDFKRQSHRRDGDATRSIHLAYHMNFSTRDMARIGYLMLREGTWAGKQVIPSDWVKQISSIVTPLNEMNPEGLRRGRLGYGYLWWVFDGPTAVGALSSAFTGMGAFGQYITVLPKLDLVIAHKVRVPPGNRSVSAEDYLSLVDDIVAARIDRN